MHDHGGWSGAMTTVGGPVRALVKSAAQKHKMIGTNHQGLIVLQEVRGAIGGNIPNPGVRLARMRMATCQRGTSHPHEELGASKGKSAEVRPRVPFAFCQDV